MAPKAHARAAKVRKPRWVMRPTAEDIENLSQLRALLAGPVGEPSNADTIRQALRDSITARVSPKGHDK